MENISSNVLANNISKDGLIASLEHMSSQSQNSVSQITGDNCDLHVNVCHMTNDKKNKSFHWFNCVAFQYQVCGNHLPDVHEVTLEDVLVSSFLPSNEDTQELKNRLHDSMVLLHCQQFAIIWFSKEKCHISHTSPIN